MIPEQMDSNFLPHNHIKMMPIKVRKTFSIKAVASVERFAIGPPFASTRSISLSTSSLLATLSEIKTSSPSLF